MSSNIKKCVLSDMDGVLYRGRELIEGARIFVKRLKETETKFLFLTNNSELTPLELKKRLESMGVDGLSEENFMTSAQSTASFLHAQKPDGSAYVIGEEGLKSEIERIGYKITESNPDYVVVGRTTGFNFDMLKKSANLIRKGARFLATNPDTVDPSEDGLEPACGSILAAVETASGRKPYVIGKPNALMMMFARKSWAHSSETVMIGDRMDTDIVAGLEAGMTTCLVLSGVTSLETIGQFPYRPDFVFNNVGEIYPDKL